MKRSDALMPLSRDHHVALVLARALGRAGEDDAPAVASRFVEFLRSHELDHFALEESVLLPAVPQDERSRAMVEQVLDDHDHLRAALQRLRTSAQAATPSYLHSLGARLRAHVLLEERELFPYLERSLDEATLEQLGWRLAQPEGQRGSAGPASPGTGR